MLDNINIYGKKFSSRMILGTSLYPDLKTMVESIREAQVQLITISLKRENYNKDNNDFINFIKSNEYQFLPNTAGCRTKEEAIILAHSSREVFNSNLIKLEIVGDEETLHPNSFELIEATRILLREGFFVLPYCTDDVVICNELVNLGCKVLMPLASEIGSGKGLRSINTLEILRKRFSTITLIIDAGIGIPSDATKAMEMGYDGVLLNSAVALSSEPIRMARAFNLGIKAGRLAYLSKRMPKKDFASPSTTLLDTLFWEKKKVN